MNKQGLIEALTKKGLEPATSVEVANILIDTIRTALSKGERVSFTNLGTLKPVARSPRNYRNIHTGKICKGKGYKTVKFVVSKNLKNSLN